MRDERLRAGQVSLGVGRLRLGRHLGRAFGQDHRVGGEVGRSDSAITHHRITSGAVCKPNLQPTEVGRQVAWG